MAREEFSKRLIELVRGQADDRIGRKTKTVERGIVSSISPLQIRPRLNTIDGIIYNAGEFDVISNTPLELNQIVSILTTASDNIVILPLIPGTQLAAPPVATGTQGPSGTDPDDTTALPIPGVGGPAGTRIINKALSYVGKVHETGENTDSGGKIDEWEDRWGLSNEPWCGMFADAMYFEAGVDDEGFGDPFTGNITARAKAAGKHSTTNPVKGCFAVHGTQHVTMYIGGPIHQADCVGGNQSDGVTRVTYDLRGWDFAIPSALLEGQNDESTAAESGRGNAATGTRPPQGVADWD